MAISALFAFLHFLAVFGIVGTIFCDQVAATDEPGLGPRCLAMKKTRPLK